MVRPTHPAVTQIGTAFHRLYQAERENALRSKGDTSSAVDPILGNALDVALAHAMAVPALRRARQKRVRIGKTPSRR